MSRLKGAAKQKLTRGRVRRGGWDLPSFSDLYTSIRRPKLPWTTGHDVATHALTTNTYKWDMKKLLEQIGDQPVVGMQVCREPIAGALNTVLNSLSMGKWNELKQRQGVDKFFHLYSIIAVGGRQYRLEKNANISLTPWSGHQPAEMVHVELTSHPTLNQMLTNTERVMGEDRFYRYDAFTNNCQDFLMNLLQSNGWLTPELQTFIKQDIEELTREMPEFTKGVASASTTLGHVFGAGMRRRRHRTRF